MNMAYVYRHIRLDKNEPFYIGMATDLSFCRAHDKNPKRRNRIWRDIVKKTEYEIEIIADGISTEAAEIKEKEFIALYGRINQGTGTLANLTEGGKTTKGYVFPEARKWQYSLIFKGRKHRDDSKIKIGIGNTGKIRSEEAKEKVRKANIGKKYSIEYRNKLSEIRMGNTNSQKGRKISAVIKEKMRNSKIGHKASNVGRMQDRPMYRFLNPEGKIFEFRSLNKFCKENNLPRQSMWYVYNGVQSHYRGWKKADT